MRLNLNFLNFAKLVATEALSCLYYIKIQNGYAIDFSLRDFRIILFLNTEARGL